MYKKVFAQNQGKNKYQIHLWDDDGYEIINFKIVMDIKSANHPENLERA